MRRIASVVAILAISNCNFLVPQTAEPPVDLIPTLPTDTPVETIPALPTDPPVPTLAPTESPEGLEEAIVILEPGPGSRVTSPVHIAGFANPTFEQNLGVQIVFEDGTVLTLQPATIAGDLGMRGPFEVDIPFTLTEERNALSQVYDSSARDGGITHLASVGVTLAPDGEAEIRPAVVQGEWIVIHEPVDGQILAGNSVHVEGIGRASFEGRLLVEVYNLEGLLVGSQRMLVVSDEMGEPGNFSADVTFFTEVAGPGRVVVLDPLPVFDGLGHIASVGVELEL